MSMKEAFDAMLRDKATTEQTANRDFLVAEAYRCGLETGVASGAASRDDEVYALKDELKREHALSFRNQVAELEHQLADLIQTSFDLCPECGWRTLIPGEGCLMCAATSVEAEREECAKACDVIADDWRGANSQAQECATAIRNRGTK